MSTPEQTQQEPLALFGGTFDPVHYGHLRCADEARRKLHLQQLYLLPAGTPPHRDAPRTTTRQRLDMLQLACREFPDLKIDDRETRRSGPSYMVDTLRELRAEGPGRSLMLLIGQDAANLLHTWHQWEELLTLAHIVVLTRPGARVEYRQDVARQIKNRSVDDVLKLFDTQAGLVAGLAVESIDISATSIKSIIRLGRSVRSMLPGSVLEYIRENSLYTSA
jgi:nicotinate-nucleotide adenylyltransferase